MYIIVKLRSLLFGDRRWLTVNKIAVVFFYSALPYPDTKLRKLSVALNPILNGVRDNPITDGGGGGG